MDNQKIRICSNCSEPTLIPVSRTMEIYNSVVHYRCETCGANVEVKPLASIGILITVGLLALGFWGYILFRNAWTVDYVGLSIFAVATLALIFITVVPLLVHVLNPLAKGSEQEPPDLQIDSEHVAAKQIIRLEKFGLLGGLLAPLVFIAIFLGIALLIGYVNYAFFQSRLGW